MTITEIRAAVDRSIATIVIRGDGVIAYHRDLYLVSEALAVLENDMPTVIEALESAIYWESDRSYRNNGFASEPYSDEPSVAEHVASLVALCDRLSKSPYNEVLVNAPSEVKP